MIATGKYINVFDDWYDVLVIINEANREPTIDEVSQIDEVVLYHVNETYDSIATLENAILMYLSMMDIECIDYGVQIIVRKYEPNSR